MESGHRRRRLDWARISDASARRAAVVSARQEYISSAAPRGGGNSAKSPRGDCTSIASGRAAAVHARPVPEYNISRPCGGGNETNLLRGGSVSFKFLNSSSYVGELNHDIFTARYPYFVH